MSQMILALEDIGFHPSRRPNIRPFIGLTLEVSRMSVGALSHPLDRRSDLKTVDGCTSMLCCSAEHVPGSLSLKERSRSRLPSVDSYLKLPIRIDSSGFFFGNLRLSTVCSHVDHHTVIASALPFGVNDDADFIAWCQTVDGLEGDALAVDSMT